MISVEPGDVVELSGPLADGGLELFSCADSWQLVERVTPGARYRVTE
ncbi:hypothetical protein [Mycobacterium lepromatosis]|nr:hypothetical protein [Mycobacterium lepromatosis]